MRSNIAGSGDRPLRPSILRCRADRVARRLLGSHLVRRLEGEELVVRIVETEAYLGAADRASHAWNGRHTPRVRSLYLGGGHAYVYFVYGMHHCFNVVTGDEHRADAVLIRAAEVVQGRETMRRLRGRTEPLRAGELLGGPAKLCQALAIDRTLDGTAIPGAEIGLCEGAELSERDIVCGPRVGVGYAGEAAAWPLRFAVRNHPEVSRPHPVGDLREYRRWRRSEPFDDKMRLSE